MRFPRSEYPSEAAGEFGPHAGLAGGDLYRDIGVSRARAIVGWSMLAGGEAMLAVIFGVGAYVSGKDPVPPLIIGGFFLSAAFCTGALAISMAGRLIKGIRDAEFIIKSLEYTTEVLSDDIARLRVTGGGGRGWGQRSGGATSPAANVHQFPNNGRRH